MAADGGHHQRVEELAVADLVPHPRNGVFRQLTDQEVAELAASLAEQGFIHPLVVRPLAGGRYEVLSGHQRLRAVQRLGLERVPCIAVAADDGQAELMLLDANLATRQLGPMEMARAIRRKKELLGERRGRRKKGDQNDHLFHGRSREVLAQEMGVSAGHIDRYDALNDLMPELQALVDAGALGVTAGAGLARLPAEVQQTLWASLGEAVGQIRVDEVRRLREDGQRAAVVVAALTRQVEHLEAELQDSEAKGSEAGDLRREIERLRARKRELDYEIQDRLALRQQMERKPGARLLELVVAAMRPLAQARPELTALVDRLQMHGGLDGPTAANLYPHLAELKAVAGLLERAVAGALPPAAISGRPGGGRGH